MARLGVSLSGSYPCETHPLYVSSSELPEPFNQLRSETWDRALHAAGTGYIFEVRAGQLRRRLNRLTFAGLVLPLAVGAVVLAYRTELPGLSAIIAVAAALGALQLIVALWSLVQGWPASYASAVRSLLANQALAQDFESLASNPPEDVSALRQQLNVLAAKDDAQRPQDYVQDISEREKRIGMRHSLLRYRRECAQCHIVPPSMKPTNCGVCGDF